MAVFLSKKILPSQRIAATGMMAAGILLLGAFFCPAHAEGTFLLQLGSYDSDAEANQKWAEIKGKNSDVLDKLTLHVAEVAMPPENKVTYRTQAGPLPSREQAANICNTLQNRGVDCYVVETALFTGETMPDQAAANTAVSPPATMSEAPAASSVAETPAPTPPQAATAPAAPAPVEEKTVATTLDPATSTAVPSPVFTASVVPMPATSANVPQDQATAVPAPAESQMAATDMPLQPALPPTDHMVPGREPKFLTLPASMAPPPEQIAAAEPAPAAVPAPAAPPPAPAEKPGFFSRLFGGGSSGSAPASSSVGNVNVAEAIRVPLSEDKSQAPAAAPRPPVVAVIPAVHGLGGLPGSNTPRTYWAQLSYFRDEYQARSFYQDFHAAYPQFASGVRVRITRPYSYATTPGHVSLRVGPFAGTQDIRAICASATHYHLRCTVVRDLGSAIAATAAPSPFMTARNTQTGTGFAPLADASKSGDYWVQLGTFRSNEEALEEWKTLHDSHKRMLRKVRISVSTPAQSSAQVALYRLRAGPFKTEASADRLCESLKSVAAGCVVLSDR